MSRVPPWTFPESLNEDDTVPMLIDGEWTHATSGHSFETFDPATGQAIAHVALADSKDADRAVAVARRAFDEERWMRFPAAQRGSILWRAGQLMRDSADALAAWESRNMGIPVPQARAMVVEAAAQFQYFGGWADKIHGNTLDLGPGEKRIQGYTLREPVGVVAMIVPWNAPIISASKKLAPALAAGCTCVLKPADETPLTALWLGQLLLEAGVPAGVVNVVTGPGQTVGAALAEHPDVDAVAFTGSTEVGRSIVHASTGNMKKLSLELGGKSPVIVMPDADIEAAIPGVAGAVFWNTGQVCAAGTRLFVHQSIFDRVVDGVAAAGRDLRIGRGTENGVDIGPLISRKQLDRVTSYVQTGLRDGATIVSGGNRVGESGYFFEPTVLVDVDQSMSVMREEIFGPVLGVMKFSDVDEAVALANDSSYGLASSVWTADGSVGHSIARRLRAGRVGINVHRAGGVYMPAGGYRQSGWGRENGAEALENYLETKSVVSTLA
ncbi:aldehyde dehydrogenase [Rhodococcus sp. 06-156-3C]|uniref:aldehyde dehydrogenase family protein n=1 Tax=Nocardiaceae TaxID=85025 RepID=UPI000522FBF4|nr:MULTISPECIES: aldehyde dehydrogenase family protein [Rhodococcus]OZD13120.1 aldehyde dehydrogenase [Rhodococcus sp. 06-156-4a]OZD17989.1 aldehyde dehydrogenase [Rhodococcus sp. 06-156-3C]OZD20713.1 aldehyde dehydrogenase [Rhodococcus sp. 06-156-4C]OZD30567.1 aldehyde dehydrogenase [Rhodococcus sp. 06-156-3b]OZD32659.1 aldehyde dehydrogenase [Rhodococcus sp. 06-156-3]